jgi:hypothetical protein
MACVRAEGKASAAILESIRARGMASRMQHAICVSSALGGRNTLLQTSALLLAHGQVLM